MELDLSVPDHTTVCRRLRKLNIVIPVMPTAQGVHARSRFYGGQSIWALGNGKRGFMVVR